MLDALYILTDANGYTSCCVASPTVLLREMGRRPMLAPVHVVHWKPIGDNTKYVDWRKVEEFEWPQ